MPGRTVAVDALLLDLENPRISKAATQDDALQKILEDQEGKLIALAQSIIEDGGLNPMDRLLVIPAEEDGKFTVIEGNRRLAALMILRDPTVLHRIEVRANLQRRLETLAKSFDEGSIEELDVFELPDRTEGSTWIMQRHTGENEGAGIVNWNGVARARFRGTDPALQALDFVIQHGELTEEEKADIAGSFPITTLDRLIRTPDVRKLIGVDIVSDKLVTNLPALEIIKPLRKIVRDLANGTVNVTQLKLKDQQVAYASKFGAELPELGKAGSSQVRIDSLTDADFGKAAPTKPAPKSRTKKNSIRKTLIPSDCKLRVTNGKIGEIEKELRNLPLSSFPHAISVLLRVFLEQSTDHYLTTSGISLNVPSPNGKAPNFKSLKKKVEEAIDHMIAAGIDKKSLDGVAKGIHNKSSPLNVDTLNNYVHNAFYSPHERDLRVSWDNSTKYFQVIWK